MMKKSKRENQQENDCMKEKTGKNYLGDGTETRRRDMWNEIFHVSV
jgi:hypothetical protein